MFEQVPEFARYYANDCGEMWDSGKVSNSGRDDTATLTVDGMQVSVAFSPGQGGRSTPTSPPRSAPRRTGCWWRAW